MGAKRKDTGKVSEALTEAPSRVRGHYATPYGRLRSVTTILDGGYPKHALVGWSARVTAEVAVENIPWLAGLRGRAERDDAADWLRHEHDRVRDTSAQLGTDVHAYLNARALGAPTPQPTETQAPYFAAVDDFLDTMHPEWEAAELVVANPDDGYAGTGDGWLSFPRHRISCGDGVAIIDGKSGRSAWGETGMQLAAYRRCRVGWLRDGREVEVPRAERGFVLHVRPRTEDDPDKGYSGGGWALIPARTDDEVYGVFLHVKAVSEANGLISNRTLADPLELITDDEHAANAAADQDKEGAA